MLIKELRSIFEKHDFEKKLDKFNKLILSENFWKNKSEAQKVLKEKKFHETLINSYKETTKYLNDLEESTPQVSKDN